MFSAIQYTSTMLQSLSKGHVYPFFQLFACVLISTVPGTALGEGKELLPPKAYENPNTVISYNMSVRCISKDDECEAGTQKAHISNKQSHSLTICGPKEICNNS